MKAAGIQYMTGGTDELMQAPNLNTVLLCYVFVLASSFCQGEEARTSQTAPQINSNKYKAQSLYDEARRDRDERNYDKALAKIREAAELGLAKAQMDLAMRYAVGQGVPQDANKAIEWLKKASDQGDDYAQYFLGCWYSSGDVVLKDYEKAAVYWGKAAAQGYEPAMINLGHLYEKGKGVAKDYAKAISWYRKRAEKDETVAYFKLGWIYSTCSDPKFRDPKKGLEYAIKVDDKRLLTVAYAANGQYDKAIATLENVMSQSDWKVLCNEAEKKKRMATYEKMMKLFKNKQPYINDDTDWE